jgi:hypothetical protein
MTKLNCPHCRQPGVSPLRKLVMSPGLPATCSLCDATSGITYRDWLTAMVPGTLLMIIALFMDEPMWEWTLNGFGLALMIAVPYWYAPLRKDDTAH